MFHENFHLLFSWDSDLLPNGELEGNNHLAITIISNQVFLQELFFFNNPQTNYNKQGKKARNSQEETKSRGVKSNTSNAPEYIGWRTTPYGPIELLSTPYSLQLWRRQSCSP
jgi:hypothetical protein